MSLDLTPGHGNLLGEFYWELISPWLGGAWMLNTGVSPNDARESSLSQILQDAPPIKYYLSPKACLGILRRASERGKALPPKLERALKIQAGLMRPDGQPTDLNAFHINQRDEGIDLHGVSGALMATTNMQMQTFVTQPDDTVEGFDGYNGDLTGDVAATLGVNCGMSTGRNGVMAFAANQRDEVRDLHDVAGALNAQPGMKQQTFVAAAFSAGAGASAGSIGYPKLIDKEQLIAANEKRSNKPQLPKKTEAQKVLRRLCGTPLSERVEQSVTDLLNGLANCPERIQHQRS
ncbi:MAG: hypothetical protein SO065_07125, partial [Lawsonibacter sp.]|nr:hypothetical protein [Lawsonibacter sp.]